MHTCWLSDCSFYIMFHTGCTRVGFVTALFALFHAECTKYWLSDSSFLHCFIQVSHVLALWQLFFYIVSYRFHTCWLSDSSSLHYVSYRVHTWWLFDRITPTFFSMLKHSIICFTARQNYYLHVTHKLHYLLTIYIYIYKCLHNAYVLLWLSISTMFHVWSLL